MRNSFRPLLALAMLAASACSADTPASRPHSQLVQPLAKAETEPMPHAGDAADDPAIWVNPRDPTRSLILGTDKQGGLHVFDMAGKRVQLVSDGCRPNNVDVLYGFTLGDKKADLAVASCRAGKGGVKVWSIDGESGKLADVTAGDMLAVFGGDEPYGLCAYRSAKTGKSFFFVVDKAGKVEQHELQDAGGGKVKSVKARSLAAKSISEGCVADDELGWFYLAEETAGIWKFPAEPDGEAKGTLIARAGQNGLTGDIEGLTIYGPPGGDGYLIASSQGNNKFNVYSRRDGSYLLTIDPKAGRIDDVHDTDGIAVTNRPTSAEFPSGVFVVQDGSAGRSGRQNFKMYDWRDIAAAGLIIDAK